MPNRCNNFVHIQATPEVIDKIRKITTKDGWFGNFYPVPAELKVFTAWPRKEFWETEVLFKQRQIRHKKLYWAVSWYDRSIKNRWTKRDVSAYMLPTSDDNNLYVQFDSARSPPRWALAKLTEVFECKIIEHSFDEWWCSFSWIYSYNDWGVTEEDNWNDAYYGKWKTCTKCWADYDSESECDWSEEDPDICVYCWEELLNSKGSKDA